MPDPLQNLGSHMIDTVGQSVSTNTLITDTDAEMENISMPSTSKSTEQVSQSNNEVNDFVNKMLGRTNYGVY